MGPLTGAEDVLEADFRDQSLDLLPLAMFSHMPDLRRLHLDENHLTFVSLSLPLTFPPLISLSIFLFLPFSTLSLLCFFLL